MIAGVTSGAHRSNVAHMRTLVLLLSASLAGCASSGSEVAGPVEGAFRCAAWGLDAARSTRKGEFIAVGLLATPLCAMAPL